MDSRSPERYFDGAQLEIARALRDGDASRVAQLASGADVNQPGREGISLLFFALQSAMGEKPAQLSAMSALVRAGADVHQPAPDFGSPLAVAAGSSAPDYLAALLHGGVDPDVRVNGAPLLFLVANHHSERSLRMLLEKGADPNATDTLGRTALVRALNELQLDVIEPLLDAGASPDVYSQLGVSFAYSLQRTLRDYEHDAKTYRKLEDIRDRVIAMGVQWPPLDPPAMRDWMRSQGMKVVVPAGHER